MHSDAVLLSLRDFFETILQRYKTLAQVTKTLLKKPGMKKDVSPPESFILAPLIQVSMVASMVCGRAVPYLLYFISALSLLCLFSPLLSSFLSFPHPVLSPIE